MLSRLKSKLRLREAVLIVKRALETFPLAALPLGADEISRRLVAITYGTNPDLFDGRLGDPLQPITVAAASLAGGLTYDGFDVFGPGAQIMFLALGNILQEVATHGNRYALGDVDLRQMKIAEAVYVEHERAAEAKPCSRRTG
jgi:hypothetical protein